MTHLEDEEEEKMQRQESNNSAVKCDPCDKVTDIVTSDDKALNMRSF